MKKNKRWLVVLSILALTVLGGCKKAENKALIFGVAPGPYGQMIEKGIKPELEKRGYKIQLKEFSDYVQPNLALGNNEISANLFQHSVYLEKFSKDNNLKLSPVISVPTAAVGIYSHKVTSLEGLKDGSVVTIPNDPTNLARALRLLEKAGLIKLNKEIDATKASEKDIVENPKKLKITPVEAAQLPRTLDSSDLAVINGNFAIAAGIPLSSAIVMEQLDENYKNLVAVRTEDLNKAFVKDIKEVIESPAFKAFINNPKDIYKDFQKPAWFTK